MTKLKYLLSILCILQMLFTVEMATAQSKTIQKQIEENIKPVGKVCVEGEDCGDVAVADSAGASGAGRSGEEVYGAHCAACHDSGAAGAPKIADIDAWSARIAKGNETLYTNAINGIGIMPAKGGCVNCSDDEIKAAVDYIVNNSK